MQTWQGKHIHVSILYSRAGIAQQTWLNNAHGAVLVDAGDGTLRDILAHALDLKTLQAVVFTHGHFDHISGLYALLGFMRMIGRKGVLCVYAPQGCAEVLPVINEFSRNYSDSLPYEIQYNEVGAEETFQVCGMTVKAYPVVHHGSVEGQEVLEQIPAMGYRISYHGEIVALTGDTGLCYAVKQLVNGADLAIIEAVYESSSTMSEEVLQKVHLSLDVAAEIGRLAKQYMLIHQGQWFSE